ncbi:YCF48-related protein [Pseudomonas corrugata]|uniref:YCF48-related protein n=1 Tax=Pseudomonas corrugata TaxID=47879 RepID=UPI0015863A1D|nr:YCF48-related protein [Pseudomonas corrugata]MCI0997647.1 glycosyl hydrolase [Pseudomonas corrugata]NUT64692.1 glycosyl hydrolase [Pseudomonas corrugata]
MKSFDLRVIAIAVITLGLSLGTVSAVQGSKQGFVDPLDASAIPIHSEATKPTIAVAVAGKRLVAVGLRGLIIFSDDQGASWRQAIAPVQSDLTAVYFISPQIGWAAGHDGIILRSDDGGASWQRQLDGRSAAQSFKAFYQHRVDNGEQGLQSWLAEVERSYGQGPTLPYLDVLFDDLEHGYAVGSFGSIAITSDGGETWQPGFESIDNPGLLNLNALRKVGGDIYIAGEQGSVFRLNRASQRFERLETGYAGSFFGLNGNGNHLLAFGLRGAVYSSSDAGQHWQAVSIAERAALTGSTLLPDGRIALVSVAGQLWISSADWVTFQRQATTRPSLFTGLASLESGRLVISSLGGMQVKDFESVNALGMTATAGDRHE